MRRVLLLLALAVSLGSAGEAAAAEVVLPDNEGRSIRFDVRVEGVDAEWYAAYLRARWINHEKYDPVQDPARL